MTHTLANGIRICTVDVPYDAECIEFICTPDFGNYLDFAFTDGAAGNRKLPEGNWTLLGRFEKITEETWKGVMPYYDDSDTEGEDQYAVTSHFKVPVSPDGTPFDSFTEAARSLIPGNPVVLIEKK